MKILIADSVHPVLTDGLRTMQCEVVEALDWEVAKIFEQIGGYDGLIIRSRFPVSAALLDKSRLKFIGRVGAGMENIDTEAAESRGIKLLNAPEGNRDAVGEHTVGMLLMLMNRLREADREVRHGIWQRAQNRGHELGGRKVGIIGYGQMGSAFAEKLRGFNVEILAYDTEKKGFGNDLVKECSLEDIYREAEVVSFHVPQKDDTLFYFNQEFLQKMQKPFYLINTSRGRVVKTSAVVKGLREAKILGACLDVLEYEQSSFENLFEKDLPPDFHFLINSAKVVLSPHIAGWTHESNRKMAEIILKKIKELIQF